MAGKQDIISARFPEIDETKNAAVWIYPQTTQLTFRGVPDAVAEYRFSSHKAHHWCAVNYIFNVSRSDFVRPSFCKTCGVSVYTYFTDFERMEGKTALNLRTVNGFDLGSLTVKKGNGRELKPLYEVPA